MCAGITGIGYWFPKKIFNFELGQLGAIKQNEIKSFTSSDNKLSLQDRVKYEKMYRLAIMRELWPDQHVLRLQMATETKAMRVVTLSSIGH